MHGQRVRACSIRESSLRNSIVWLFVPFSLVLRSCLVPCSMFPRSFQCPRHRSYPPDGSRACHFRPQVGIKSAPQTAQIGIKSAPRAPEAAKRRFRPPRPPLGPPQRAEVGSKLAQVGPKSAPSWPQVEPKRRPRCSKRASCAEVGSRSIFCSVR